MNRTWSKANLLRAYRAGILAAIFILIHAQASWLASQRPPDISLRRARQFFPTADRVQLRDAERGLHVVTNARGDTVGALLRTSPFTDGIIGYSGPSDVLIALDNHGVVAGLELLRSGDTPEHVRTVRRDPGFLGRFVGWKPSDGPAPPVQAVSGATLTSYAIAESVQQRLSGAAPSLRFPDPLSLSEVQAVFTNATRLTAERSRWRVADRTGRTLGYVIQTSPQADNVSGYRGPTDCLVALGGDGRTITAVRLRKSYDTESYVDQVRRAEKFLKLFVGRQVDELAALEFPKEKIEGLSGATQTARAVLEGLKRRSAAELRLRSSGAPWRPAPRDLALAGVIAGGLVMSFTRLRGQRWTRLVWQCLLVGYVGLVNRDFLSLALLGGWAANGLALKSASGLVLLAAAAFFLPMTTRRQVYCHQLCPHGAAQQLLGGLGRRLRIRRGYMERGEAGWMAGVSTVVPGVLLGLALVSVLLGWPLNLAAIEPFDAWSWRAAGVASIVIALVGLAASLFVPQAYCRFGCPTGALLSFIRSAGSSDRWTARDGTALILLIAGAATVVGVRVLPHTPPEAAPTEWHGRTMGTTWSVKVRDEVADQAAIEKAIARELEWAESMTSHWRTNTDVSEFNRTQTTNAMAVPWPVVTLSRWAAEVSRATGGAYDVTVGPLVRLWGFGPGPRRTEPPTGAEVQAVLPSVGWQQLEVLDGMIRKQTPGLELDFSSIAKGWAIDQVCQVLERRGYTNYLVEAGGELRVRGRWNIGIEHPSRSCKLADEAIATSGTYRQNFGSGPRRYSHLIDPRTGRPVAHQTVSVSVRASDCGHADAWSTALNVLGAETGLPLADRLGLAAEFTVERPGGSLELRESAAWKARVAAVKAEK